MREATPEYELLVDSVSSPMKIGIYRDGSLLDTVERDGYVSDILPGLLYDLVRRYSPSRIVYVNGPGSQMAIKLTYIALMSVEATEGIEIGACSAFSLNGGAPLKAMGSLYFIKEKETIITRKLESPVSVPLEMPETLDKISTDGEVEPLYILPAV